MQKIAMNEIELAKRWGISPKTLQRWRSEGRGPRYLKLSKRVAYPVDEILHFEARALHESTWQKASDVVPPGDTKFVSVREVAAALSLPIYVLADPRMRKSLGIPSVRVGSLVKFNLDEVTAWAKGCSAEMRANGIEVQQGPEQRRTLLQALSELPA